jgi:hypothetical protein
MPGVPRELVEHTLNVDPKARLVMIRITPAILGVLSRSFTASLPGYKSSNNAKNVT